MKKFLTISMLLLLIFSTLLPTANAATITADTLDSNITKLNSILSTKIDTTNPDYLTEIVDENGNVPAYQSYPTHVASRSIKELAAYDGKIFMGLGDWNDNTGPVKVLYYDTTDGKVKTSGTIADEAIQIFNIIDDKLYTTGCDPRAGWGYGSYYIYNTEENKWDQHQKNDGWIHAFNIVEFKNKLYMCGSTVDTTKTSSIQSSSNNGETFESVLVFKDGTQLPYNSELRCYNLAVYNNKLYGYIGYSGYVGIYEYDETKNEFHYISNLPSAKYSKYGVYSLSSYNRTYFKNAVFNNKFIFVSGTSLYTSTDLKTFTAIEHKTTDVIQDVVISNDTLYTLSYQYNSDKTFTTRIYGTKDLKTFDLVYEFITETPPFSITHYDNSFYVGTAYATSVSCKDSTKNGSLYRINLKNTTRSLTLNKNNKTIVIYNSGISYTTKYDINSGKTIVNTTLTFNNTMNEKQAKEEYNKIRNLNLIFATVANSEGIDLDSSTSYYNNVLTKNNINSNEKFTTPTSYAKTLFAKELNITDNLFTITSSKISETDDEYKTEVTLTINNEADYSALKPVTEDNKADNNTNNSKEDYSDTNSKLPQTGRFFEFKNVLQIIIVVSMLLLIFFVIKGRKSNKPNNKE